MTYYLTSINPVNISNTIIQNKIFTFLGFFDFTKLGRKSERKGCLVSIRTEQTLVNVCFFCSPLLVEHPKTKLAMLKV